MTATLSRQGETLVFTGVLDRAAAAALWPQLQAPAEGLRQVDLSAVPRIDSAGLALLAELAARAGGLVVLGQPEGLDELRAAYRLQDNLSFSA